ncbi:hypothetical protein MASR1M48_17090 [Lactococcus petauri]
MTKEIWINDNYKHKYFRTSGGLRAFMLCQVNGSLASIKSYDSEEEAIKDGWKKENYLADKKEEPQISAIEH